MTDDHHKDACLVASCAREVKSVQQVASSANRQVSGTARPGLVLVVDRGRPLRLEPNSVEVTRLMADKAKELCW